MVSSMKHCRDHAEVPLSLSLSLGAVADRKKKLGRRAAAGGGEGDGEFACKTCGRSFPTFQALGGHRTSHLRGRHGLALALAGDHYSVKPKNTTSSSSDDQKPAAVHRCHVCGLEFEMGQALGGHMRRHREEMALSGNGGDERWVIARPDQDVVPHAADRPPVLLELFV